MTGDCSGSRMREESQRNRRQGARTPGSWYRKKSKLGELSANRVMIHTCYDQLCSFRLAALLLWARLTRSQLVKFSKYAGQLPRRRFLLRPDPDLATDDNFS